MVRTACPPVLTTVSMTCVSLSQEVVTGVIPDTKAFVVILVGYFMWTYPINRCEFGG